MRSQRPASSSPFKTALIAALGMGTFYLAGQFVPGDFFQRYFWAHPLERISAGMFFVGLAILIQKFWGLRSEGRVLRNASSEVRRLQQERLDEQNLQHWVKKRSPEELGTHACRRVEETLHYVSGATLDGLEDHLRYLAELASDRLHQTFATIRTITWAIPILGFLGTVIGITMAIANVTPEQLDSSIGEVTQGLSVAFDTTALALGLSIVLVFASFAVERSEQKVLADVEQFGIETLLPWFSSLNADVATKKFSGADATSLADFDGDVWTEQLTAIRGVWSEVLQEHALQLKEAIDFETQQTLQLHRESCDDARDAYSQALQQSSQTIVTQCEQMIGTFEERVASWQDALRESSRDSVRQTEALHELGATLLRMTESEERLARLQTQLNENLQALEFADTMERTASSLTAAVHVLTAKTTHRNAA